MIDNLCPNEIMILANAIAISLSEGKSADELNVLGNLIVAVGSLMLTAAAQIQFISSQQEAKKSTIKDTTAKDNFGNSENSESSENSDNITK